MSDWLNVPGIKEEINRTTQPAVGTDPSPVTQTPAPAIDPNSRIIKASIFGSGAMWSAFFGIGIMSGLGRWLVFGVAYYAITSILDKARSQVSRSTTAGNS